MQTKDMKKVAFVLIMLAVVFGLWGQGTTVGDPLGGISNLYSYRSWVNTTRYILVTSNTTGSTVWGSNGTASYYTDDSDIHRAFRHYSGVAVGSKRIATVSVLPGGSSYTGTTANDVTTSSYGSWGGSYRFTGHTALSTPTSDPSSLSATSIGTTGATLSWSRGNGHQVIVFVKQGTATDYANPPDYATYTGNTTFGSGTLAYNGYRCVYKGTGTSVTISGLSPNIPYSYNVLEYNYPYAGYETYRRAGAIASFTIQTLPSVSTLAVSNIGSTSATGNGNITNLGSTNPTQYGHCWNTTGTPTTSNSNTTLGSTSTTGTFTSSLTGLSANTLYYVRAYATNTAGTAYGDQVSFTTLPLAASYTAPANAASGTDNPPDLSWTAPSGGCAGYKLYLGTDTPPTNVINGELHAGTTYTPALLQYNTTYYWMAVPYNGTGDAQGAAINSFTTTDTYGGPAPQLIVGETTITPAIQVSGITGDFTPTVSTSWNPEATPYQNVGLQIVIGGVNMSGRMVVIDPDQGFIPTGLAWRIQYSDQWNYVPAEADWRADYAYFTVDDSKADGDLEIVFPDSGDITLPVNLSTFSAIYYTQSNYVMLKWVAESETNHLGYNVLRSESGNLQNALRLNDSLITAGQSLGTQVTYQFRDQDVYPNATYHYWLESVAVNGNPQYHGPIMISSVLPDEDAPNAPLATRLIGAYPNPFNPSTTISFALDRPERAGITIYNVRGQIVKSFEQDYAVPGNYSIIWDGKDDGQNTLSSGIYYYRLTAGKYHEVKKLILSK
jgi:hypothetical protein